jgi:hypothetical protein
MVRMISNKSAAFGAAPVVACSVMLIKSARARCDGDAANERLMAVDRRAIRAVADDGYEPFRKDNARSGKTEAARSARREQALLTCAGETSCAGISKMRLEEDMRRPIMTTASVIALGVGLALGGATQANAWSHHAAMHSSRMHMSRAEISDVQQKLQADNLYRGKVDGMLGPETRRAIAD